MVLHPQPIANLAAAIVEGQLFSIQGIRDEEGDQFFGVLIGSVIIRTAGDHHVEIVGPDEGEGNMVGTGLRSRVGAGGLEQGLFIRQARRFYVAIDLIRADLQKARPGIQTSQGVEQNEGSMDIGVHKGPRPLRCRAIDMGFRRKMQQPVDSCNQFVHDP